MRRRGSRQNLEGWLRRKTAPAPPVPKPTRPPQRPPPKPPAPPQPRSGLGVESTAKPAGLLPMQLQVGDRFTDEEGEWEIVQAPFTTRQGKLVHATIRQPGDPASTREKTWPAYERLTIERTTQPPAPKDSAKAKRSSRGRGKDGT